MHIQEADALPARTRSGMTGYTRAKHLSVHFLMCRTLKNDYQRYAKAMDDEDPIGSDPADETGWKQVAPHVIVIIITTTIIILLVLPWSISCFFPMFCSLALTCQCMMTVRVW
jgi:1,4-dihydroxy-2-naphthoate octaprenyltransferase